MYRYTMFRNEPGPGRGKKYGSIFLRSEPYTCSFTVEYFSRPVTLLLPVLNFLKRKQCKHNSSQVNRWLGTC